MNSSHEFGGAWTQEKLEILRRYLEAYLQIMRKRPQFKTIYVDAFAGTGDRTESTAESDPDSLIPELEEQETQQFFKGSARLVLEMDSGFQDHVFVETSKKFITSLEALKAEFPGKNVHIFQDDANHFLQGWCTTTDWRDHRAVLFLDPYGMQIEWKTLQMIAATRAIDLWLLFPIGMGVNRLLTKEELPPSEWMAKLTRFFGTESWIDAFYKKDIQNDLFSSEPALVKDAPPESIKNYFLERLKTIFPAVAPNPRILTNSRGNWLYLLVFAVGNPYAVTPATSIANHLLDKDYGRQIRH